VEFTGRHMEYIAPIISHIYRITTNRVRVRIRVRVRV